MVKDIIRDMKIARAKNDVKYTVNKHAIQTAQCISLLVLMLQQKGIIDRDFISEYHACLAQMDVENAQSDGVVKALQRYLKTAVLTE